MLLFSYWRPHTRLHKLAFLSSSDITLHMSSRFLLKPTNIAAPSFPVPPSLSSSNKHFYQTCKRILPVFCAKPISKIHPPFLKANGFSFTAVSTPEQEVNEIYLNILEQKLTAVGIEPESFAPGQYNSLLCPVCEGGNSGEKSLSLFISPDGSNAVWNCFRGKCGWSGNTRAIADSKSTYTRASLHSKVKRMREITEEGLQLQPLCGELLAYFKQRLISEETLQRNHVKQKLTDDQVPGSTDLRKSIISLRLGQGLAFN